MNTKITKIYIAIVLVVVILFASSVFAFNSTDNQAIKEAIQLIHGEGSIDPRHFKTDYLATNDYGFNGATVYISSESLIELEKRGIYIHYGTNEDDEQIPTLWAVKDDEWQKIEMGIEGDFVQLAMADSTTGEKWLTKDDAEYYTPAMTGFDYRLKAGDSGTGYAFAPYDVLGPYWNSYQGTDGTVILGLFSEDDNYSKMTYELGGQETETITVPDKPENIWTAEESTTIKPEDCVQLANGLYRYYFKVAQSGTWNVQFPDKGHGGGFIYNGQGSAQAGSIVEPGGFEEDLPIVSYSAYVLVDDVEYYMDLSFNDENDSTSIQYEFMHSGLNYGTGYTSIDAEREKRNDDEPEWYEKIIAWFIRDVIGVGVQKLIALIAGEPLSIDKILFDQYDKTTLTFFNNDVGVNKGFEKGNSLFEGNLDGLTQVFNLFRKIAIASFLIILVYMGIRVLLMAGDARRKAKYKEVIFDWIRGVIILVFFPYVIRYIILINHAFVVYVGDKAKDIGIQGATIQSVDGSIDNIDAINADNLNSSDNPDYMEQMYLQAKESMRITDALCWLVMLIQIIQFLIVYFQRLITILFLIAIFPLVTITYALDKIADGKSQAFNNWFKDFTLQVFIQSFHAINYVVIMGIILNGDDVNWIFKVIGISYIAKGGDMIRGLFAQMTGGGGAANSALDVAKSFAKTKMTIEGIQSIRRVAGNMVGSNSMVGKGINRLHSVGDTLSNNRVNRAERKLETATRLNIERTTSEQNRENARAVRNEDEIRAERDSYNAHLSDPELSAEDRKKYEEHRDKLNEQIRNYPESFANSLESLSKLSEEDLTKAMQDAGFTQEQMDMVFGAMPFVGSVGVIRHRKFEKSVSVRTAVEIVRKERFERMSSGGGTTGNELLDKYMDYTNGDTEISEANLKKISAANSYTYSKDSSATRVRPPEPAGDKEKLEYALNNVRDAHMGEDDFKDADRDLEIINSMRGDATYDKMIADAEEKMGFTINDFELNLNVQRINESNNSDFIDNPDEQARTDKAIRYVKSVDRRANKEILSNLRANINDLQEGYVPILREKEDERSKLQIELQRTLTEDDLIGRRGEAYENLLDDVIRGEDISAIKGTIKGVGGIVGGGAGGVIKTATTTGMAGVSLGATYTGADMNQAAIMGVANTTQTVDKISGSLRNAGGKAVDSVIKDGASAKVSKKALDINRKQFNDGAIDRMVDEKMNERKNIRDYMKRRKS